jgi:hypothetical protein
VDDPLVDALNASQRALADVDRAWCVVGGVAMAAWTPARFTKDLDLAVAVADDRDAEGTLMALLRSGWRLDIVLEQARTGRLATARLFDPEGTRVDLLFAACGIEADVVRDAVSLAPIPGLTVPVARPGHLVAMKLLSVNERRFTDAQDLIALLADLDEPELARARRGIAGMDRAGTTRGRDLTADLDTWLARARG